MTAAREGASGRRAAGRPSPLSLSDLPTSTRARTTRPRPRSPRRPVAHTSTEQPRTCKSRETPDFAPAARLRSVKRMADRAGADRQTYLVEHYRAGSLEVAGFTAVAPVQVRGAARMIVFGVSLLTLFASVAQAGNTLSAESFGPAGKFVKPVHAADMPHALAQVRKIKAQINARNLGPRGSKLAVTEASSTGVIESFSLLSARLDEVRVVPANSASPSAIALSTPAVPTPPDDSRGPQQRFFLVVRRSSSRYARSSRPRQIWSRFRCQRAASSSSSSNARSSSGKSKCRRWQSDRARSCDRGGCGASRECRPAHVPPDLRPAWPRLDPDRAEHAHRATGLAELTLNAQQRRRKRGGAARGHGLRGEVHN